jgi:hypothetical protein
VTTVCTTHEVTGYPTFKYFKYGKNPQNYMGGREVGKSNTAKIHRITWEVER